MGSLHLLLPESALTFHPLHTPSLSYIHGLCLLRVCVTIQMTESTL